MKIDDFRIVRELGRGGMQRLSKTELAPPGLRLNRAACRRASALEKFVAFREPEAGDAWFSRLDEP